MLLTYEVRAKNINCTGDSHFKVSIRVPFPKCQNFINPSNEPDTITEFVESTAIPVIDRLLTKQLKISHKHTPEELINV